MKKFLFLAFGAFVVLMVYMSNCAGCVDRPLVEQLERAMLQTRLVAYHDDDYDYTIKYPMFFEPSDDSLMEKGCCRFSFWQDSIEIVQSAFVLSNADSLSVDQAASKYAAELHATHKCKGNNFFILSGSLHSDTGQITGRRFYAKFVRHRKLWFVQNL
ncbi:MAG: hypothetical protein IJQ64_01445, partial [Prevotella sp.]|nr:hypothetical protein [Prevotella sp.]